MSNLAQLHFSVILRPWILVWLRVAPCKGIKDTLGFWIPRRGFRIPGTGFRSLSVELGLWISIVSGSPDFLSCIPNSKAQHSRFHKQNFPPIPDSKSKNFPDSGIPTPLHGTTQESNPRPPTLQPIPLPTEWILLRKVILTFFSPILGIFILSAVHKRQVLAVSNQVLWSLEWRNPAKNQTKYVSYMYTMLKASCNRYNVKKNIKRELHFNTVNDSRCTA